MAALPLTGSSGNFLQLWAKIGAISAATLKSEGTTIHFRFTKLGVVCVILPWLLASG
jgi:acyl-CoA reductase-like NAD-dependent aldehyde dehydrogenase